LLLLNVSWETETMYCRSLMLFDPSFILCTISDFQFYNTSPFGILPAMLDF
jgi:hypothetical protein